MAAVWFILTVPTGAYQKSRFRNVSSVKCDESSVNKAACQLHPLNIEATPSSSGKITPDSAAEHGQETNPETCDTTIAHILTKTLEKMSINDVVWSLSKNDTYYQVTFPSGKKSCEEILRELQIIGIGSKYETTLSVLPCTLQYNSSEGSNSKKDHLDGEKSAEDTEGENAEEKRLVKKAENSFAQSIKSRLTVAQVVEGVRGSAVLTFDFIMFVLLAGMLAALGLVENSSVILVASMLVSPMMGPILCGTFGIVIQDRNLQVLGVKTELIGLALCLCFGFAFGIVYGSIEHWSEGFWLTDEMIARGRLRALWVGVLIALPSGAGVALSVLGGNAASLVGVAISASLLPPVVNAGLLWAVALTKYIGYSLSSDNSHMLNAPEGFVPCYSDNMAIEALLLGVVSCLLTLINILCIFIMGVVVLKIKEVTPERAATNTKRFWGHDIKEVRNYNRTVRGNEAKDLIGRIREDFDAQLEEEDNDGNIKWREYVEQVANDPVYQTVRMKTAYCPNERISQMTWPVQPESTYINSTPKKPLGRKNKSLKRSLSSPREAVLGQVTDNELEFRGAQRRENVPSSPTKRITWNFPFHRTNRTSSLDRQGRFVVTRAEDPISVRHSKGLSTKDNEFNTNLYDIHELVP